MGNYGAKGESRIKRHNRMRSGDYIGGGGGGDRRLLSDDTMSHTKRISEIYDKLTKYVEATRKYRIEINRGKVAIVVKMNTGELRNFRGIIPWGYRK